MKKHYIISIDQSTSATKAVLFNDKCESLYRATIHHEQYYPKPGWVEHDAEEIYANTVETVKKVVESGKIDADGICSVAITNQRETAVVWNKETGKPVYRAVVWQCQRGADICAKLVEQGYSEKIKKKSGLIIDPYFSASGIQWILDNVEGARSLAEQGKLLAGTIDSWLLWKLTDGKVHATDYTNASRTLLFNIHTLDWDDELLDLFTIPRSMMPDAKPCDSVFGESTVDGIFTQPVVIAGILGDSHGALAGQMCFDPGMGKSTYGTGSSVMVNIGEKPIVAPGGLVTSVGFAAHGKVYYAYEGNIHCTGATIKWLEEKLNLINSASEVEAFATSIPDNGGVYFVPAFAGLSAPWWNSQAKAMIHGMTLGTGKAHVVRAALEAIAYQVKDLVDLMTIQAGISLKELRVDGGPTKNHFLMQFQSDMLDATINCSNIEEASALGAAVMNGLAQGVWKSLEEVAALRCDDRIITPKMDEETREMLYSGWIRAIGMIQKSTN
ncbi:glycerol kinase GlpK [Dysgonomonas sp. 520]|uniref:glycerol kinase GlpK n=1 Tax=Dysgonomonas sp. 520 TaxID=2302931 RepID=UPI0013D6321B|nr:glycerol kinase GlpK [Dysgonomonas sp. 520]NDW08599.1 glycerol kinase [Dysgonomonas sp. 520]